MKLKTTLLLIAVFLTAANIFGQKTETKAAETKASETKPAAPAAAKLPSVREILDKYVQAIGGREANEKIKTRALKGAVEIVPMGVKGTAEIYASAPDKLYTKINFAGIGDVIESFNGTTAWTINPIQGNRDKTGAELLQAKLTSNFYREVNLDKLYAKMEVAGAEKIGDKEAYVVTATPAGLDAETFYFDKQSGLLLRHDLTVISPEGKQAAKNFFDDYREIDGVKMPFKIRTVLPQFELATIVTEIKHGVAIDDKIFVKPAEK